MGLCILYVEYIYIYNCIYTHEYMWMIIHLLSVMHIQEPGFFHRVFRQEMDGGSEAGKWTCDHLQITGSLGNTASTG